MPKPENTFIGRIHKKLKKASPGTYFMKTNNPYVAGIPDCYYEKRKVLWVEYKYMPKMKNLDLSRPSTAPSLSKLQQAWLQRSYANAIPTAVIVGVGRNGGLIFEKPRSWLAELTKEEVERYLLTDDEIVEWIMRRTE